MHAIRNTGFIIIALIIDLTQAGISTGLSVIAAFPGTVGGGAAGCAAGGYFLGQIGCWLGGVTLAAFGSVLNPLLAAVTIPVGFAFGFAINMCLSIMGGAFLLLVMKFFRGHVSWNRLYWSGGELIPGLNNLPFWTFFVIASAWDGASTKKQKSGVLGVAGAFLQPTRAVMSIKDGSTAVLEHARERGEKEDVFGHSRPLNLKGMPEPQQYTQPTSASELVHTSRRPNLQDVRPTKPNAQTA